MFYNRSEEAERDDLSSENDSHRAKGAEEARLWLSENGGQSHLVVKEDSVHLLGSGHHDANVEQLMTVEEMVKTTRVKALWEVRGIEYPTEYEPDHLLSVMLDAWGASR